VADDGFDLTHPDFQGEGKVAGELNALLARQRKQRCHRLETRHRAAPRRRPRHAVAWGLGGRGNGSGVVGVAPGCALLAVRFPLQAMTDAHFIVMSRRSRRWPTSCPARGVWARPTRR